MWSPRVELFQIPFRHVELVRGIVLLYFGLLLTGIINFAVVYQPPN